jgi:8-oxo-dGTP diphosphatase
MTIRYVVGFAIDFEDDCVLLIKKNRPAWQAGKLNGIGGKIEGNERPEDAMCREFLEETGVETHAAEWINVITMHDPNCVLHTFLYIGKDIKYVLDNAKTMETEEVGVHTIRAVTPSNSIHNLPWKLALMKCYFNPTDPRKEIPTLPIEMNFYLA